MNAHFALCAFVLALGIAFVTACGAPALAPVPTATVVSVVATSTAIPPTDTAMPPTATTPNSPTHAADLGGLVAAALKKDATLSAYRVDGLMATGAIHSTNSVSSTILFKLQGERKGQDAHLFYTTQIAKPGELIKVGDKLFVRDQATGAEGKWFSVPQAQWNSYPLNSPLQIISALLGNSLQFTKSGTETLDGVQCDVYLQDRAAVAGVFLASILDGAAFTSDDIDKYFDRAESKVWICADDYLHQLEMHVAMKPQSASDKATGLDAHIRLYDLNGAIQITAPADAMRFPTPTSVPTNTPIPTRTPRATVPPAQATATVMAAENLLQATQKWNVLLTDSFDSNQNQWMTGDGKAVANGKYVWDMHNRVNIYRGLPEMKMVSDFAASIDARLVSGSPDCGMGLSFRNGTDSLYGGMTDYVFYIHDDQRWGFDIIHNPDPGSAQDGTSNAIVPRALNRILVIAQHSRYTFFVNGKYVGQADDGTLLRGKVGAAVWVLGPGSCQVEFDNFQLSVPPTAAATITPAKTIMTDWTPENPHHWPTGNFDVQGAQGARAIAGTIYRIQVQNYAPDQPSIIAAPEMAPLSDFDVSVDAQQTGGSQKTKYGIAFRHTDPDNGYVFSIAGFGAYSLAYNKDGEYHALIFPTPSDAIKPGEVNHLRVVGVGSRFTFYINGEAVTEIQDDALTVGTVGVLVEAYDKDKPGASFDFENFILRAPPAKAP